MRTTREWQSYIHEVNIKNGWWEGGVEVRNLGEALLLCLTELAEVADHLSQGRPWVEIFYQENGKPDGVAIEIADFCIRVYDLAGAYDVDLEYHTETDALKFLSPLRPKLAHAGINTLIAVVTLQLCYLFEGYRDHHLMANLGKYFARVLAIVRFVAYERGINIDSAMEIKMAYNEKRPYRHGGKLA